MTDHGPDMERHKRFLIKTQYRIRVVLFCAGILVVCGVALTYWGVI